MKNSRGPIKILLLFYGCICGAGLLYARDIRKKKPVLCYAIRFGVLFVCVILLTCGIGLVRGGMDR